MMIRVASVFSIVAVLSLASAIAPSAVAVAEPTPLRQAAAAPAQPHQAQPNTGDMMKMHQQMMAEMKAADARLDALVRDMNAAAGEARVNAVAAVINELVQQQKAMHEHMEHMQQMGCCGTMMHR